jgi:hypothetical protein
MSIDRQTIGQALDAFTFEKKENESIRTWLSSVCGG